MFSFRGTCEKWRACAGQAFTGVRLDKPMKLARLHVGGHTSIAPGACPFGARPDIGRIRDGVAYFAPDWRTGREGSYLGEITEDGKTAGADGRENARVRSAHARWQNEWLQRAR